jgi:hypothetical protein
MHRAQHGHAEVGIGGGACMSAAGVPCMHVCMPTCCRAPAAGIWHRGDAIRQHGGQRRACQDVCGQRGADDHHDTWCAPAVLVLPGWPVHPVCHLAYNCLPPALLSASIQGTGCMCSALALPCSACKHVMGHLPAATQCLLVFSQTGPKLPPEGGHHRVWPLLRCLAWDWHLYCECPVACKLVAYITTCLPAALLHCRVH